MIFVKNETKKEKKGVFWGFLIAKFLVEYLKKGKKLSNSMLVSNRVTNNIERCSYFHIYFIPKFE